MKYGFEVLVKRPSGEAWERVGPTRGQPYSFDTREAAEDARRLCYGAPEHAGKSRVVEVDDSLSSVMVDIARVIAGGR